MKRLHSEHKSRQTGRTLLQEAAFDSQRFEAPYRSAKDKQQGWGSVSATE